MREMILGGKGALPQQVIDYFDNVDNLDSDQVLTAVNLFKQATRSFDGRITRINPRGIKDDTRVKFEALANVVDTLGNDAAPEFLNNLQIYMDKTKEAKDEMLLADKFDYVVENDILEKSYKEVFKLVNNFFIE